MVRIRDERRFDKLSACFRSLMHANKKRPKVVMMRPSVGFEAGRPWQEDLAIVQLIVDAPVLPVVLQPATDPEPVIRGNGHVAPVEEGVDVRAEQQAVADVMYAALRHRPDVGGLEHRECLLPAYSTVPLIGIGDGDPKSTLAETRAVEHLLAVHLSSVHVRGRVPRQGPRR